MSNDVCTCAAFQREMMSSIRATHPDWGEDILHVYETRFAELMRDLAGRGSAQRGHPHPRQTRQMI